MSTSKDLSNQQSGVDQSHKEQWMGQIMNTTTTSHSEATPKPRIQKIPQMLTQDTKDYEKYFVPRVVSLGPYHHGNKKLEFIENLKPMITNKFVNGNKRILGGMYDNLLNKIEMARSCYEENSIGGVSEADFTSMMLQDGCFILHCIDHATNPITSSGEKKEDHGLKSHHIAFIQQDLFLLENQVPYLVLEELMKSRPDVNWCTTINNFINSHNIIASERVRKGKGKTYSFSNCCIKGSGTQTENSGSKDEKKPAHLLELLQTRLVGEDPPAETETGNRYTFRNVNELLTVGIHFKPSKSSSLADIKYRSCGFSASVELPPITVDDATRPTLLNLVAYEMCANVPNESWVTSYICFLDSLIDHADDVKELRKAGILDNSLGSDEEVAILFNEIGTDLVPNPSAYAEAKRMIQKHYEDTGKTYVTQLKHEYFKNPWSLIALCGAVLALFLSSVQAYFSVWSTPGECDQVCKYIKQHHHL